MTAADLSSSSPTPADQGDQQPALGLTLALHPPLSSSSTPAMEQKRSAAAVQTQPEATTNALSAQQPPLRNRSPYSQVHFRSHSASSTLTAPPMTRAHSLPSVINASGHLALSPSPTPLARPSSPLRSPKRTRSPFRTVEESFVHSGAPSVCDISEDAELELTPRAVNGSPHMTPFQPSPMSSFYGSSGSLPRSGRRRPTSPLHQSSVAFGSATSAPAIHTPTSTPSTSSSPMLSSTKFNEPFPGAYSHYPSSLASSSVPSTPTSMRSRSPSISSLETIPDSPDAEAEALEADRIARLKAAADRENGDDDAKGSGFDVPSERRTLNFGKRDSRKRWSVCGAERRGDLDLETIWED